MKRVEKLIFEMLTENTGTHFLDSGGDSGRMFQRNASKTLSDFQNEDTVSHELYEYKDNEVELTYTISVFHYLVNQLELDETCENFNTMQDENKCWESDEYGVSNEALEYLESLEVDINNRERINTCNHDSNLSQVLLYRNVEIFGECYLVLQIHGGADVRGGYTVAKLFKLDNEFEYDGGFLNPEDVHGTIDGVQVDNMYNGYSMTTEDGEDVKLTVNSKAELHHGF